MKLSGRVESILRHFKVSDLDPDLLKAQYKANTNQIPLMYFLVLVSTWGLASSFIGAAPNYLSLYLPVVLSLVAASRFVSWARLRSRRLDTRSTLKALRATNRVSGVISLVFVAWAISLTPYSDDHTRGHISFYIGITTVGCMFCLMHIRSAALMMALVINGGFIYFAWNVGDSVFVAEAINVGLASAAMYMLLNINFRDFRALIESRRHLITQQKELIRREAVTRRLSDETVRLAYVDVLTDLPNRRHFFEKLEEKMDQPNFIKPNGSVTIGILDLDGFKRINDVFGHTGGDNLLKQVAACLRGLGRTDMFVSRLGGDEFAMILDGQFEDEELEAIGADICRVISETAEEGADGSNRGLDVTASIGFARWQVPDLTPKELYERADYALYQVKRSGKGKMEIFSAEHEIEIQRIRSLEFCLRTDGIERELSVVYQPIIDTINGKVLAFEALARWNSEVFGAIPPTTFIPVAERIGLIDKLTHALLQRALDQLKTWPDNIKLSFNLSPNSMTSSVMIDRMIAQIEESGVDPCRVDVEITETAMIGNFDDVLTAIDRLKAFGVGIVLDDFGTGYSSLAHLHLLSFDKIKIDKSFVSAVLTNSASFTIVKSMLALGRQMEVGCVVEGVETEEVLKTVRRLGGTTIQGYLFSRPMAAKDILPYLAKFGQDLNPVLRRA
ncbi:putative bifunctional diguanylate cyclase/phosphodiesterase [Roseibium sp.]|uniref:putative bifunctional diguanylate cyclase/phosphodiesterase n=1 Tax=Roseibium sp. TaxID=1936156 RepID=UPI003A96ECAF